MVENNQFEFILDELQKDMYNPEIIQDNKLHFRVENDIFYVSMPTQKDFAMANDLKNRKYLQLLRQKNEDGTSSHLLECNLIDLLKTSQNIDINELNNKIAQKEQELTDEYITLASFKDTDVAHIQNSKNRLEKIKNDRLKIILEKAEYLAPAIQHQAQDDYYKYLTSVCTFKYKETDDIGDWTLVWKDFKHFNDDTSVLKSIALGRLTELLLNVQY